MCSLEEAYNIPSYESSRKKRGCSTAPLRDREPYPPYDDHPRQAKYISPSQSQMENFDNYIGITTTKGVTERNVPADAIAASSYCGRSSDNNAYCKSHGICGPELECFANEKPSTCTSTKPQMYKYPISDKRKKQYEAAMKAALDDSYSPPNAGPKYENRKYEMDNVNAYYDEDLEDYLIVKDNQKTIKPVLRAENTTVGDYDPQSSPFALSMNKLKNPSADKIVSEKDLTDESLNVATFSSTKKTENMANFENWASRTYFFDIFLFVAAGLLVILLCDQLFRFGVSLGIKETVMLLKPYMENVPAHSAINSI